MNAFPRRCLISLAIGCTVLISAIAHGEAASPLQRGPFVIHFQPADAGIATLTADTLEQATREFAPRLALGLQAVKVTIAGTFGEFIRLAGSFRHLRVSGIARPELGEIVVQSPRIRAPGEDYLGTLRHELLHILLHRNTHSDYLPRWLNEGLCMSYANEYYWQGGLQVSTMFLTGRVRDLSQMNRAFTRPGDEQEFSDAYAQALSVVRFMRDRLGEDTFWAVIHGTREDFFEVSLLRHAGIDLPDLWKEYERSLWVVALIGVLTSGSLLGPGGFILAAGWWRTRKARRARLREMAAEERRTGEDVAPLLEFEDEGDLEEKERLP